MKKSFLLTILITFLGATTMVAQPRAIGVNLGPCLDISYQHTVGDNMVDVSLNCPLLYKGIGATAIYDWINPFAAAIPWDYQGAWNWYMGAGLGVGAYHLFSSNNQYVSPVFYAGVTGHIGIEYQFWFPLELSLDWRPNFSGLIADGSVGYNVYGLTHVALGVRYKF